MLHLILFKQILGLIIHFHKKYTITLSREYIRENSFGRNNIPSLKKTQNV